MTVSVSVSVADKTSQPNYAVAEVMRTSAVNYEQTIWEDWSNQEPKGMAQRHSSDRYEANLVFCRESTQSCFGNEGYEDA